MPKRTRKKPAQTRPAIPPPSERRRVRIAAFAIFAAALGCRLLFWQATPDRTWAYTAFFKGDAPVWLEYASALERGQPFELGLPIHPPATAYLLAFLWNGRPAGNPFLRFAWVLLGALVPLLLFLAAERSFGLRVAAIAGGWAAVATGLLLLSSSLNNETPYLVLAVGSLWFVEDLRKRPSSGRLAVWSAVNGAACLFRVEHVLFYLAALAFFAVSWIRSRGSRPRRRSVGEAGTRVAASLFFFALPLVPWHATAWAAIGRFNGEPRRLMPVEESAVRGVEEALSGMSWSEEARRKREELPAFLQRTAAAFVLATVAHRGGREVRGEHFGILEEAFGYFPRPLGRFPFVSSYGPLNFYLANHPGATGGFDRSPLEQPPPLAGGAERYPHFLVRGLPPEQLTFVYPPHLRLFNEGYSLGWKWIRDHPGEFARLAARKLSIFWSGAALGLTGYNLPPGLSGVRRAVDLVTPEGGISTAWRVAVLAVCALGLAAGWRRVALWPWLLFLASKIAATVLFFGYARQGATVIPVLALLLGLAAKRWVLARLPRPAEKRAGPFAAAILLLAVGVEGARLIAKPVVLIDGQVVGPTDSFATDVHRDQRVEVR
jgi:hypothetical protein